MIDKHCPKCAQNKPLSEFHSNKGNKDGLSYVCKPCKLTQNTKWRKANKEKVKEIKRVYNKRVERKLRDQHYKRNYGISIEQFESMESLCMGVCGCCGAAPKGRCKRLSVDHCHKTGKIRGLLCAPCNKAIGVLGDSVEGLRRAVEYLEITT